MLDLKKLRRYANKFTYKVEDAEDVFQEACLLFYEYPTAILTKKFYLTLIQRASWRIKFKQTTANTVVEKNQDVLSEEYDELVEEISSEMDLDNLILLSEFRTKLRTTPFSSEQQKIVSKVLSGEDWNYKDRGHIEYIKNKLRRIIL